MQLVHGEQLAAFADVVNVPASQVAHVRSAVVLPDMAMACPGTQAVQDAQLVAACPSWSQVPLAHGCFGASAPAQYVPASHAPHTGGELGVAAASCSVPAAQAPAGTQLSWFGSDEYVPSAHGSHRRSTLAEPAMRTRVPGAHGLHGEHDDALADLLNVPLAHAVHVRSVVASPSSATACPGTHGVRATHGVAGLASWSHAPSAHVVFVDEPPAQYVPASQAVQTGAFVEVPAAVSSVPAAHAPYGRQLVWFDEVEYVPAAHGAH